MKRFIFRISFFKTEVVPEFLIHKMIKPAGRCFQLVHPVHVGQSTCTLCVRFETLHGVKYNLR